MDKYGYIGIETLLNFCENSKDHSVTPNDFMRMKRVRMPERKNVEWIPVSDRLPEDRQKCLVAAKSISDEIGVALATYFTNLYKNDKAGWYGYDSRCGYWKIKDVIAWMPYELPEPYREEGE